MKFLLLFFTLSLHLWGNDVEVLVSSYHLDEGSVWSIENAYSNKEKFEVLTHKNESLGFNRGTVWIYVKVQNLTDKLSQNMIEFPYPLHDYISVYTYKDGKLLESYMTGDLTKFDTRKIDTNNFVIPYTLKAQESKEMIFKINSNSSLNIGMKFLSLDRYYSEANKNEFFLGGYYGAVIIMLIYNFILFLMIKDSVYLDYVTFHFLYTFFHLGLNGLAFQYVYPNLPSLNLYLIPVLFTLANYFSIKFSLSFLDLERYIPKTVRYFKILMNVFLLLMVLSFFLSYSLIITVVTSLSMLSVSSLFATGIYVLYKERTVSAKFYVAAWGFLLAGALVVQLQNLGLITMNTLTLYGAQIGALFELALFSLALAYRYNLLFVKLNDTEQELRILNKGLEKKVQERTYALDERNKELSLQINNKNVLFRELYHRVKNNLQIISSLLTLQVKRVAEEKSKDILTETTQRIKAMAMIHERLYQSNDLAFINMQSYTQDLAEELQQGFKREYLSFHIECESVELGLEAAVPMGLIINELVTNAIKYAFDENQTNQIISIKMYIANEDTFILEVYDNGKGVDMENVNSGFGFKLVQSLAKYQLKGDMKSYNDPGLHHKIIFSRGLLA